MLTRYLRFVALAGLAIFALSAAAHHVGDSDGDAAVAGAPVVTLTGTVEALVVIDRVNAKSTQYPILVQLDGTRIALRGEAVQAIVAGAQVAVTGSRTGTMFTVGNVQQVALPKSTPVQPANPAQVSGKFMVAHADNFDTGTSQFFYQVFDSKGGVTDIVMPFLPGMLTTGTLVQIVGRFTADGASIVPDFITIESVPALNVLPATTNYIVLPIKFPNSDGSWPVDPFTPASLNTAVFGALPTKSAKEFYKEVSYGLQQLSGITADDGSGGFLKSAVPKPATCDISVIASAAANAARLRGYPIDASGNPTPASGYTGLLYVFTNVSGCGWAGLAYVGWPRAYSNNTSALWVIGHELGHNFGLLHAGSLRCPGAVVGCVNATVVEYGDPFSSMGNSGNTGHFNATQKDMLGYTTPAQTKNHGNGTATYTLDPIETGGLTTYGVRIPTANASRTYWLEYRQPVGVFDAFVKLPSYPNTGAQVRIEYPFEKSAGSDDTELLDMTPATFGNVNDAALLVGQTYTDSIYGVIISVLSSTPSALTVQVTTPGAGASTITQTTSLTPAAYAAPITFTATVTGAGLTGNVNFTEAGGAIAGCAAAPLTGSGPYTATCTTSLLIPGTHSIIAIYAGNSTHAASAAVTALTQVVNKSPTSAALVSSANPSLPAANVTFTVTVNGVGPTGTVNFKDGATTITGCGTVALTGGGNAPTAACSVSTLSGGTHNITAVYSGDTINATSTSPVVSQGVGLTASTTGLASSVNPTMLGTSVTFTATVNGNAPTGTVNFTDGGASLAGCGNVALTGSGDTRTATCVAPALVAGLHPVTATYGGNGANVGSASGVVSQAMMIATTTGLATSLTPQNLGKLVKLTATVTGNAPTGPVAFMDGAAAIPNCTAVPLTGSGNARTAVCNALTLAFGSHSITAVFAGDPVNVGSTSPPLTQDISAAAVGPPAMQITFSRAVHGSATFDLPLDP